MGKKILHSYRHRLAGVLFKGLLPLVLLALFFSEATAQNRINILEADRIVGGTYEGDRVQKILGNVHLDSQTLEMYCDSAYQFVNKSEIQAFGNIEIVTGSERIWSDTLVYFTDVDFSQLRGRVIIETDSSTLFGNSVDYRFSTKVAHFIDEIRLEDQRGILKADSGFYFRQADSAVFRGQVQLSDSLQYLEGDSLFSSRRNDYYEMYSNIFGDDRENHSMLSGNYLEADSTGRRLLRGDAWMKNFESDTSDTSRTDTTHIQAHTILSQQDQSTGDTTTVVHAYENVRIWSPSFSAIADTSRYSDSTSTFELWSNSIAWHEQVQLTGPYINAKIRNGDIDSLKSYPRPFSVQQDTSIDRLNQITGDTLEADFTDAGELHEIFVYGKAHLLRFTKNEQDKPDGAIDLTAPSIRILFEKGDIDSMRALGSVKGSYLPENKKTADKKLEGFAWDPKKRPQRPGGKMERRFPPIPAELQLFEPPQRYIDYLQNRHPDSPLLKRIETKETRQATKSQ